ncbi:MAG: SH3 domain-containing protein [Eubacteriales bacterium]
MKILMNIISALLTAALLTVGVFGADAGEEYTAAESITAAVKITSGSLNVRSGGGTEYDIIGSLERGENVEVTESGGEWSKIVYGEGEGYVASRYISPLSGTDEDGAISLGVVSYKQYDQRWAWRRLGSSGYTVYRSGCTLTCYAMSESYRTGALYTPLAALSDCSFTSGGALYWSAVYTRYYGSDYLDMLRLLLEDGTPVLIEGKNISGGTHWVIVTGHEGGAVLSASGFTINDPGSETRATLYDFFADYPYYSKLVYYS